MRLLNVWCFPLPRSSAWLSSDLISRWSSLTFILCSGCLSFIFHWSIFEQGGLWRVGFVWPVVRQSLHTRPGRLASVMYSFSSWLSFCSSSFAVATCTFKTVTLNLISCCFESKGLRPCWAFRADVGLADASSVKRADGKVDAWYDSCLGSKQRSSSPVFSKPKRHSPHFARARRVSFFLDWMIVFL